MLILKEMKVVITNGSLFNTEGYSCRVELFVGPSVTSLRSLKVKLGFLFGFMGRATLLKDWEGARLKRNRE